MMSELTPLPPGSTIGILGGGQLGRMLSLAAAQLGMKTHIYCPEPDSPAFEVTPHRTVADYEDKNALAAFADVVDVITYEFENVPESAAAFLSKRKPMAPGVRALAVAQDRLAEKRFLSMSGIEIAPYRAVENFADLEAAIAQIGTPAVLKATRMGYDGKGQRMIDSPAGAVAAFTALSGQPLVLEGFVAFEKEISVVVARNGSGMVRDYDPAENVHKNHILHKSIVPARIDKITARQAGRIAAQIVGSLDYIGVMGVEFFVVEDGKRPKLLVNEIAPRVHNSGHWTQSVCPTDQFEQHIRAICNWPLGLPVRLADVEMENILGHDVATVISRLGPGMCPRIYGKSEARPGRKMAHINRVKP